jgi:ATP-dependent helicase/nuclease subunit A
MPTAPRDLRRKTPSGEEGGHAIDIADVLRPRSGGGFSRGSLIHRWMQEVVWVDEFATAEAALPALGAELEREPTARNEAFAAFRAALERPQVRALLSRPEGPEAEVWREREFSVIVEEDGHDVLWSGSFDRVVLHRDASGELLRADVIDYKTDRVDAGVVEARAAFYAPQLTSYASVLARMTGLARDRIGTVLAFLEPGIVHRLEP